MLSQVVQRTTYQQRLPSRPAQAPAVHTPAVRPGYARTAAQCRASAAAAGTQLALHLGETTVQLPFSAQQAKTLDAALSKLLQTFADKQAAERPRRWESLEVQFKGEEVGSGLELVELFCNPNSYKTAFDAKLMINIRAAGGLKVVCEGRLSSIKADLDAFIQDL